MIKDLLINYINSSIIGGFDIFEYSEIFNYINNYLIENEYFINQNKLNNELKKELKVLINSNKYNVISKNPYIFSVKNKLNYEIKDYLIKNNLIIKERNLHIILENYLDNLNIQNSTIYHEKSKNKELLKWQQPDVIGYKDKLYYSFEIKRTLTLNNLRESFFQCLSNSNWANFSYLVCHIFNEYDNNLIEDFKFLNNEYNIGLIKLDQISFINSKILFEAKPKDLNQIVLNKLIKNNIDVYNFIINLEDNICR